MNGFQYDGVSAQAIANQEIMADAQAMRARAMRDFAQGVIAAVRNLIGRSGEAGTEPKAA